MACDEHPLSDEIQHYQQMCEQQPDTAASWTHLGDAWLTAGCPEKALPCMQRASELDPQNDEVFCRLGSVYARLGDYVNAAGSFHRAVSANARSREGWNGLGAASEYLGRYEEAFAAYHKALAIDPEYSKVRVNLAALLTKGRQVERALDVLRPLLQGANPDYRVVAQAAKILEFSADNDAAYKLIVPLLDADIAEPDVLLILASICRSAGEWEQARTILARVTKTVDSLSTEMKRDLFFQSGTTYDALGSYQQAFEYFSKANNLAHSQFDADAHHQRVERIMAAFKPDFVRSHRASGTGEGPLFIVGMPRSGTTLVEQILASHHSIEPGGESPCLQQVAIDLPKFTDGSLPYPECVRELTQESLAVATETYLQCMHRTVPAGTLFTDKTPQNFSCLGLIELLFPNARVIHCRRDPLDTCLSCYFQDFRQNELFASDLSALGAYYREYRRLMEYWESILSLPVMTVEYESLVTSQELVSRQIIDFCGLPWDDACLEFYSTRRIVHTASYQQVRRKVYRSSVGRWRNYDKYLGPLKAALGSVAR